MDWTPERMRTNLVSVSRSRIDPIDIADLAMVLYRMPKGTTARLVSSGLNDVYRIDSMGVSRYLRVTPAGWRTHAEIDGELEWIRDCAAAGLPTVRILQSREGHLVEHVTAPEGTRYLVLFAPVPSTDVTDLSLDQARLMGVLMACLHQYADESPKRYNRFLIDERHLVREHVSVIEATAEAEPGDMNRFREIAGMVADAIDAFPRDRPLFGMCHGDLHAGNVRFGNEPLPWVFDFDCCGYGWRAYDMAVFLWNFHGEGRPKRYRAGRWNAFRRGYTSVRTIEPIERRMIPYFVVARHIWLTGLDFAGATNWPPQWLTKQSFARFVQELEAMFADVLQAPESD